MIDIQDNPIGTLLMPEVEELIRTRQFGGLREALGDLAAPDVADILRALEPESRGVAFRVLGHAMQAEVFEYLPADEQEELLHRLGQSEVAEILNDMAPDDRTALLEELPGGVTQRLIAALSPEERAIATRLLGYPEESIGRRMTPEYVTVRREWSVTQVFEHLRRVGQDKETLNALYVVDDRGVLLGDIRLRQVVLADPASPVADLMDENVLALRANDDQEQAVRAFKKYDRVALPVVDSSGVLVGMVTVDDVLDVAEQEETEDIQKMAGMEALNVPYVNIGLMSLVRKRAGWLIVLFIGELGTAVAVGHFEEEIATAVFLAVFMPLIISSGGNSGSQAASLVIRALAVGEVSLRDWWHVLKREIAAGILLGLLLGILAFVRVMVNPPGVPPPPPIVQHGPLIGTTLLLVAIAVGISVVGCVLWGTLAGSMLPFIMKRLGFDPASSSTPFVATLVDVTGIVIYFMTAVAILKGTLL